MAYAPSTAAASQVLPAHAHHLTQQSYLGSPTLTPAAVPAYNVHVLSGGGGGGGANGATAARMDASAGSRNARGYGGGSDGGSVPRASPTLSSAAPVFSMATGAGAATATATATAPGLGQVTHCVPAAVIWCAPPPPRARLCEGRRVVVWSWLHALCTLLELRGLCLLEVAPSPGIFDVECGGQGRAGQGREGCRRWIWWCYHHDG